MHYAIINTGTIDTNMIFARAIYQLLRHTNMMAHEPARRPASMFDDRGAMKVAKTKLFLRLIDKSIWHGDRQKVDGCAVLWVVPSPSCETRQTSSTSSVATYPAMWNPIISTRCSTDARQAVPIRPIQLEMTEMKGPTESTRVYSLSSTAKFLVRKLFSP